ncbi:MAG TPA: SDR family oxidoreductase [Flavisolibacter sp.]|nr:SDR family oxidoreductase [Flavisolibacter sp.]
MQRVFVTGANGFVGQYLVEALLTEGYFVVGSGRGASRMPQHERFVYCPLDLTRPDDMHVALLQHQPDCIVHCAAISKPDECETDRVAAMRINLEATRLLLQEAEILKAFFIFLSTDFVFSGEKEIYSEEDDTAPVNYYGYTKERAEAEVRNYQGNWSIVRTILVYGKPLGSRQNLLTTVAAGLRKGQQLKIFGDQVRTPTFVGDLVKGICAIIEKRAQGIFHLSGKDVRTPYQMAVEVANYLGFDVELITQVSEREFHQPARRPPRTVFDLTRAANELDYRPVSFEQGLRSTFSDKKIV